MTLPHRPLAPKARVAVTLKPPARAASAVAVAVLALLPARAAAQQVPQDTPAEIPDESAPGTKVQSREKKVQREGETTVLREKIVTQDNSVGTGVALFLGLDLGLIKSVTQLTDIEGDKQGTQVGGRLVGSVYPEHFVFDLGLGWFYSSIKGEERLVDPAGGQRDADFSPVKVITYAAFAEFAARWRMTHNWQLGIGLDAMFGEDLSFSSEENPKAVTGLVGLQLFYGVPEKTADVRWGLSVFTDINVPDRQMYWGLLSVQLGLPLVKPDVIYREKSLVSLRETEEKVEVKKEVKKVVVKEVVKFVVAADVIRFPPKRALLGPENQRMLIDLSNTLRSVDDSWEEITVEGHVPTDAMPTEALNLRLSSARAAAVRNALVSSGVRSEIAKSKGFGSSRPYDSTDAVSPLNERIELSFTGVTNAGKLNNALNALLKRKLKPETCGPQGCK